MNDRLTRTFKAIFGFVLILNLITLSFIGYLYYQNYQLESFEKNKKEVELKRKQIVKSINKLSTKKFNIFDIEKNLIEMKNLNSEIIDIEKRLGVESSSVREDKIEEFNNTVGGKKKYARENEWSEYVRDIKNFSSFAKKQ